MRPLGRLAARWHRRWAVTEPMSNRRALRAQQATIEGHGLSRAPALHRRGGRLVAVGISFGLLLLSGCHTISGSAAGSPTSTTLPYVWPKCRVFHPVTKVSPSVPFLGSGEASLGWGTAHPADLSTGGEEGTVVCITWRYWGAPSSYGQGWAEVATAVSGRFTKWVARIELQVFDLGHCTQGGHLAYKDLDFKEPSRPGGSLGPWEPWVGTGRACSPQVTPLTQPGGTASSH
jgi:hypothetical protein